MLELIINKENNTKTIMLVENGILREKHEEHENQKRLEGNIYIGKVQNVLQGMQSAFINIGEEKNTFIRLKDLLPKVDETKEKVDMNVNIKNIVKQGMNILVQVKKDGSAKKGARVSTHINLPGRYIVFMPNSNFITVSQKIQNEKERERLIGIVQKLLPQNTGAIIRTASENIQEEMIIKDFNNLIERWKDIQNQYNKYKNNEPILVYDSKALLRKTVIETIDQKLDKIIVNDKEIYNDIKSILNDMEVQKDVKLEIKENENLFTMYTLEKQLEKLSNRKIWLKCGGFITIDRTEALTAIDVNTGKYIGTNSLEKTIFTVNKEATVEIAKQLRLRDIGGIIIIDYIDMENKENEQKILELLKDNLQKDRTKSQILGFTKLNLLEMTRKNMCNNDEY